MFSATPKALLQQRVVVACGRKGCLPQSTRSLSIASFARSTKSNLQPRSAFAALGVARSDVQPLIFSSSSASPAPVFSAVPRKFSSSPSSAERPWMNDELYKSQKVSLSMRVYQFLKLEGPKNRMEIYEEFKELVESKVKLTHRLCRMKDKQQLITQRDPRLPMGKKARFVYSIRRDVDKASFVRKRGMKMEQSSASTVAAVALEPDYVETAKQA